MNPPRTGNSLAAALTDKETIAGTSHILSTRWSISNGSSLIARVTLDHMLKTITFN